MSAFINTGFCADETKLLGPVQDHPEPPFTDKVISSPLQVGVLLEILTGGAVATLTLVVAVAVQPEILVTVTVYVPDCAGVILFLVAVCPLAEKLAGPLHCQLIPLPEVSSSVSMPFSQTALAETDGVGIAPTESVKSALWLVQLFVGVQRTLYKPAVLAEYELVLALGIFTPSRCHWKLAPETLGTESVVLPPPQIVVPLEEAMV